MIHSFDGSIIIEETNPEVPSDNAPTNRAVSLGLLNDENNGANVSSSNAAGAPNTESLLQKANNDKELLSWPPRGALQKRELVSDSGIPTSSAAAVVTAGIGQLSSPKVSKTKTRGPWRVEEEPITEDAPALVEKYSALCGEVVGGRGGGAGTIVNKLLRDARNQVSCSFIYLLQSPFK